MTWQNKLSIPRDGTPVQLYMRTEDGEAFQHVGCWLPEAGVWLVTVVDEETLITFADEKVFAWKELDWPDEDTWRTRN